MHFSIPNTNDRKEKIKQHKTNALLQIFGITFDMLKEWNDSSKCYPRNRKIVSGKNGKITPLLKALANASNSSLRRNADYFISQMEVKPQFK